MEQYSLVAQRAVLFKAGFWLKFLGILNMQYTKDNFVMSLLIPVT